MNTKQILKQLIFAFPAIYLFTGFYLTKSSPKVLVGITIMFLLFSLATLNLKQIITQISERKFVWALWCTSLFVIFSKYTHGYGNSEIRVFVCIAIYASLIPNDTLNLLKKHLNSLIILACIISFAYAFHYTYISGLGRSWPINPNPYSTFSASVTILSLYYLISNNKFRIINLIAFSLGLSSVLISQTRGSLLSLIIATIILLLIVKMRNKLKIISTIIALILSIGVLNYSTLVSRFEQSRQEMVNISSGNLNTSIGYRFQIWQAGYELAKSPTLIGIGKNYLKANEELYKQGNISKYAIYWDHYHNQYINSLIKNGVIGLLIFLYFMIIPIFWHIKYNQNTLSILGLLISTIYMVSSLTEIPFNQSISLGFYLIFIFIISSEIKAPKNTH